MAILRPSTCSVRRLSRELGSQTQKGVRIGLVVADSDVLVYSPTPQLIEAGSNSEEKPNAIRITGIGPKESSLACGANDAQVLGLGQEVGLNIASEETVKATKADLEENPPRRFDLVRLGKNLQLQARIRRILDRQFPTQHAFGSSSCGAARVGRRKS